MDANEMLRALIDAAVLSDTVTLLHHAATLAEWISKEGDAPKDPRQTAYATGLRDAKGREVCKKLLPLAERTSHDWPHIVMGGSGREDDPTTVTVKDLLRQGAE